MVMVDVDVSSLPVDSSQLTWYEDWRPSGAQSAFITWTGWTLAMAMVTLIAPQTDYLPELLSSLLLLLQAANNTSNIWQKWGRSTFLSCKHV